MTPAQREHYIDAAAAALGLPLRPEHRPGVLQYLALAEGMAALVEAVPLTAQAEAAVNFAPVVPPEARA